MTNYIRLTSSDFAPSNPDIPDAVLDVNDTMYSINVLPGMGASLSSLSEYVNKVPSMDAGDSAKKSAYQQENNIKPGTPEWFKLWFTKPNITNTSPYN